MNAPVRDWVKKAEGDYFSALREYRARKNPNPDAACFHAQQCIEKYLKGSLEKSRIRFTKTHDLLVLLRSCMSRYPLWGAWEEEMKILSRFAVLFRYPGESATRNDARTAVRIMKKYRGQIRHELGLSTSR